ncbi:MAG: ATP-grasp domain-containing protein [Micrococcus sp.]|nr:ATP-grasp domain-containing protein [Micrococcus sp.]
MNIDILMVRHPADRHSPVIPAMIAELERHGATVRRHYPDEAPVLDLTPETTDLLVLKAKTPAALEAARAASEAGVACFPPYATTQVCRDKVATTQALHEHGVPVPETWTVTDPAALAAQLAHGPLILKPIRGSQGRGIEVIHTADELEAWASQAQAARAHDDGAPDDNTPGDAIMAQRYHAPDGRDRKIYRIGEEVFCVERVWPPRSYADKLGRLVELPAEVADVARRCGEALGIDTYGVDIIEHAGRPYVVDLSSFPGFKGVPDAGPRLAARVLAAAHVAAAPQDEARA